MRIDKLLCELNIGTRSQVKELLKRGQISVNGEIIKRPEEKVDELTAEIVYGGKAYHYRPFVYYMMNKPAGIVTATKDNSERTVLDLFKEQYAETHNGALSGVPLKDLFPVGRLDKDTVGLLLLTNDGELAHRLLSPAHHIPKQYYVETNDEVSKEAIERLSNGVPIGEEQLTRPAIVKVLEPKKTTLTITEGKFHQVKRMFEAVGLKVTYLKRLSMGNLVLDEGLQEGQIRELKQEEVMNLC